VHQNARGRRASHAEEILSDEENERCFRTSPWVGHVLSRVSHLCLPFDVHSSRQMLQRSPSWAWTQRREAGISYVKVDTGSISRHTSLVSALTGTCAALCFSLLPSHVPDHPAAYMIHVGSSAQLRLLYTAAAVSLTIVGATINTLGWDSIVLPTAPLPDDCVVHWSKCTATWYQVPLNMCY